MKKIAKIEELIARVNRGEEVKLNKEGVNPTLYWAYRESLELKQKYLDFHRTIWERDIPDIVKQMRADGKRKFTVSNTASGMTETIQEFINNGCRLTGMTAVKSHTTNWQTGENDIIPAFLLTLKEEQ